jgi:hypothetical protein
VHNPQGKQIRNVSYCAALACAQAALEISLFVTVCAGSVNDIRVQRRMLLA